MPVMLEQGADDGVGGWLRSGDKFMLEYVGTDDEKLGAMLVAAVRARLAEELDTGDMIGELDSVKVTALSLLEDCGADANARRLPLDIIVFVPVIVPEDVIE